MADNTQRSMLGDRVGMDVFDSDGVSNPREVWGEVVALDRRGNVSQVRLDSGFILRFPNADDEIVS